MSSQAPPTWLDAYFTSLATAPNAAVPTLTQTPLLSTWSLVQPDEVVTLPLQPAAGVVYRYTTAGTTFNAGHPVTFQRPTGASYLIQNPQDPNNVGGSSAPAASVTGTQNNRTYGLAFDGVGLMRIVS